MESLVELRVIGEIAEITHCVLGFGDRQLFHPLPQDLRSSMAS